MTTSDYINCVRAQFAQGKTFVELISPDDPVNFRKRMYEASRRRGLLWMFAICDNSLFIKQ